MSTLAGEPESIWTYLGSNRLDGPIQKPPDLVLHGHAHAGTFAGSVGPIPVYNVAVITRSAPLRLRGADRAETIPGIERRRGR
jgi:hypothetical protein